MEAAIEATAPAVEEFTIQVVAPLTAGEDVGRLIIFRLTTPWQLTSRPGSVQGYQLRGGRTNYVYDEGHDHPALPDLMECCRQLGDFTQATPSGNTLLISIAGRTLKTTVSFREHLLAACQKHQ